MDTPTPPPQPPPKPTTNLMGPPPAPPRKTQEYTLFFDKYAPYSKTFGATTRTSTKILYLSPSLSRVHSVMLAAAAMHRKTDLLADTWYAETTTGDLNGELKHFELRSMEENAGKLTFLIPEKLTVTKKSWGATPITVRVTDLTIVREVAKERGFRMYMSKEFRTVQALEEIVDQAWGDKSQ
ncbi:hypothetical protein K458DRAFT_384015 [Lentithecium fluviatile CBS 122367]|uniref:Uncharacterized protein n=1 Tax=Lentithecium fluviatile CBS 122367 TaxID=1168545 RepID=A0A6G1JFL9_9PLEO|nr:hypothetical protein K458DRAFT_384015 [Lentithecium fluviatile CBS 122367]